MKLHYIYFQSQRCYPTNRPSPYAMSHQLTTPPMHTYLITEITETMQRHQSSHLSIPSPVGSTLAHSDNGKISDKRHSQQQQVNPKFSATNLNPVHTHHRPHDHHAEMAHIMPMSMKQRAMTLWKQKNTDYRNEYTDSEEDPYIPPRIAINLPTQ